MFSFIPIEKIDKLHQIITNYPLNTEVNLVINKLAPIITEKEVFEFVINTVKEKVNMVNLKNHPTVVHKHNYNFWTFSVDKETALKCLILEGKVKKNIKKNIFIN